MRTRRFAGIVGIAAALAACSRGMDDASWGSLPEPPPARPDGGVARRTDPRSLGLLTRLGPTESAERYVPPIAGATLLVTRDDARAVAADPDLDVVWVVDLGAERAEHRVELRAGDEPGRAVEGEAGRVHVALRRGGAVVTVDVASGRVTDRRAVCAAPRGIAWDEGARALHVACAGGELVTLPEAGGEATRRLQLPDDLRDVAVTRGGLVVSRFRSAELVRVRPDGTFTTVAAPEISATRNREGGTLERVAGVAWRMVPTPTGVALLHQVAIQRPLGTSDAPDAGAGYGDPTTGAEPAVIAPAVSTYEVTPDGAVTREATTVNRTPGLAVDLVRQTRSVFAVALPGHATSTTASFQQVNALQVTSEALAALEEPIQWGPPQVVVLGFEGQVTAVARRADGAVVAQTRAPAGLLAGRGRILFDSTRTHDTGHELFHAVTSSGLACASCHPEGGDDGRVWDFERIGRRLTPSLRGGIAGTAPFHWDGDMRDMAHLAGSVFTRRMGGVELDAPQVAAVARWIDRVPTVAVRPPEDTGALARGEALFRSQEVGCAGCHGGARFTNNLTVDVGTGGAFQVPPLVGLGSRTRFLHEGCASTLRDRFTNAACGGGESHGHTAHLTAAQLDDLVAYLRSL